MIKVFPDKEELSRFAAERFVEITHEKPSGTSVALAGGSTPKSLYNLLASAAFREKIDWNKVFFFFGDERNVTPDDPESNFRMAEENLFQVLDMPDDRGFAWQDTNVYRWQTEAKDPEKIAENYRRLMKTAFSLDEEEKFPRFDLILLGMGADGHTASLFPNTKALHETERTAVANYVEKLNDWRFTLTFPVINNARNVIFLATGEEKAETLKEILEGEFQPKKFPAQSVKPHKGNLMWLVDEQAARLLK